ncbi:MAG: Fic family protein [Deferribacteres bacterium]|nr:Fic family protein [candidate division KSB1 bacterium]MCB9504099.1 Fic family protein [Deferribacteres bacterium]
MRNFKPGSLKSQGHYKSFEPAPINRHWSIDNMEIALLLSKADRELGRLDMYSEYIPNLDLFISMHVVKEATQSSKIEGTQTNLQEALLDREDVPLNKRDDWEEVQNYIEAMRHAISRLNELPFSSRLIKETHKILLQGVRGAHKTPGDYRKIQNWIGGASIEDAVFVPPAHTSVETLMADLEKFVHNDSDLLPELLKIALIHYQFETIHPFLDGNGRVGRLLITLYLVSKKILKQPVLYLSDFFERNRSLYYDNLMSAREKNDLTQWFKFFLVGVTETAQKGIQTFDNILQLKKQIEQDISALGNRAANAQAVVNQLYKRPLINAPMIAGITGLTPKSVYKLIATFEELGILREVTGGKRKKLYLFQDYINLFYA